MLLPDQNLTKLVNPKENENGPTRPHLIGTVVLESHLVVYND